VRKAYRVADSKWVDFERRGVTTTLPNYVTAYAATHPQEDFAETFRFLRRAAGATARAVR